MSKGEGCRKIVFLGGFRKSAPGLSYRPLRITVKLIPVNTKHLHNIYTMLDQHRRRCADVV